MIVSSGSSRNSTPSGAVISERCIVAAISMPETSTVMFSGMSVGRASMLSSRVTWSSTPPSLTPGRLLDALNSDPRVVWIFSSSRTSSRSMCMSSSRTGWSCWSLTMTGASAAPTLTSNSAEPSTSTLRSSRWSTLKDTALAVAAAVEDAGHRSGAPEAAHGTAAASPSAPLLAVFVVLVHELSPSINKWWAAVSGCGAGAVPRRAAVVP